MKKLLLLISLSSILSPVWAQKVNVDSLIRVALADTLGKVNYSYNKDSLFRQLPLARTPAERITMIYEIINYGLTVTSTGQTYHYKILNWAKKNGDPVSEAVITAEIGADIAANGDIAEGVKTCFRALKLAEKTGDKRAMGIGYQNLGMCYRGSNNDLYKFYIKKALIYSREGEDNLLVEYELGDLSEIYGALHQPDSASYYALKRFEWAVNRYVVSDVAGALVAFGLQQNDNVRLRYLRLAEKLALNQKGNFSYNITFALGAIGGYYHEHNNLDSALFYARKAYNATRTSTLTTKLDADLLLSQSFKKNNADSILKYTLEYYNIRDSLQSIGKIEHAQSMAFEDEQNRHEMETQKAAYRSNLRLYILAVVIAFLFLLAFIFWRNNRKGKLANHLLQQQKEQVQQTLQELKATQTQLIQSEKMASLGELTAGIAHEIQNPLNFVNNFSEVNTELIDEMEIEIDGGNFAEVKAIADDIKENQRKINIHGKRADGIVKGMLQHSRASSGKKEPTDINALADEYLRLAYHGLRAKDKNFNAEILTRFDKALPKIDMVAQDIGRVLLNLFNNAFYAVYQKQKIVPEGYNPAVELRTTGGDGFVEITVKDNGNGISENILDKIMQPFFTTKPAGEGTGLGLSISYDIVKVHGGSIDIKTEVEKYTLFKVKLPIN